MKMEVTELGPMKRALKIEVPADEVTQQFSRAYLELNRQVQIPGFRPGKAPLAILEKRYAKTVEEDVIRKLVPDFYDRAIKQAGISPVVVDIPPLDRVKIKKDSPFTFTATVEIKPTIELRDYKSPNPISLQADKRTVAEEQVDRALEVLREQHARLDEAQAGTVLSEGDYAIVDLEGFLDGAPLEGTKKEGQLHKVGSKAALLGIEIDAHLIGRQAGDTVEIPQTYPVSHPDQRVAGKAVGFRLVIKGVKQKKLPTLDDEFAKDCGPYESLHELRDKLRGQMEKSLRRDIEESYKDTLLKRLIETHHFDLPDTLVERELSTIVRQTLQARQRGKVTDSLPAPDAEDLKKIREENREEANRRVKAGLILEAIAEKEGLSVSQDDLNHEVTRLATELRVPVADLVKMIQAGGQDSIEELRARILADKALDAVYRQAVIQG
ncbi:trigger factor [Candidatus Nitrospira nitrificans]|uniref:Trigger factor n=1 Tax=Candidatus Nitrospira nitrificans TaxID=1742973 RepID=A0A0S4LG57_9BACT|nr:trigger factor [Candidatus Nitrospira nitrificans]CUS34966.1 Trigger factor [Candidatus Nitrospira nitrificans]